MTSSSQSVHRARQEEEGGVSSERINLMWMERTARCTATVVPLTRGTPGWWSYIGNLITCRFTACLRLRRVAGDGAGEEVEQDGPTFVPKYLDMWPPGGSEAPHVLVGKKLGVDVNDPGFWEAGAADCWATWERGGEAGGAGGVSGAADESQHERQVRARRICRKGGPQLQSDRSVRAKSGRF